MNGFLTDERRADSAPDASGLAQLYERMYLIRRVEESLLDLFSAGKIFGTTHTCIGQEANAAGVIAHLERGRDVIVSNHRCHGHYLAFTDDVLGLLREVMGKEGGVCGGRGGSQHLCNDGFYSNGILGSTVPLATGMALAERERGADGVVVAFLGDGTLGQGVVYESLNIASLWQLPILYVVENNFYAQSTPSHLARAGGIAARGAAFGIETAELATTDVAEITAAAGPIIDGVRANRRPFFLVLDTYRFSPHSKGDDFRDPAEIEEARTRDPLRISSALLDEDERRAIEAACEARIEQAIADAEAFGPGLTQMEERCATVLNEALIEVFEARDDVYLLGEDILDPYGGAFKITKGLSTRWPDRVITTPVSEASLFGVAAGMALRGYRPILEVMFGDFIALGLDQVVNGIGKFREMFDDQVRVPLVVRTPMGGGRGYGPTHSQSLEKLLLAVPGITVVAANECQDLKALVREAVADDEPVFLIENKVMYGRPNRRPVEGFIGELACRESDSRYPALTFSGNGFGDATATIVTYGGMLPPTLDAAVELILEEEVFTEVVALGQLLPLDLDPVLESVGRTGALVTVEEGTLTGGFGAEVAARVQSEAWDRLRAPVRRVATADGILPAARQLEQAVMPGKGDIVEAVLAAGRA